MVLAERARSCLDHRPHELLCFLDLLVFKERAPEAVRRLQRCRVLRPERVVANLQRSLQLRRSLAELAHRRIGKAEDVTDLSFNLRPVSEAPRDSIGRAVEDANDRYSATGFHKVSRTERLHQELLDRERPRSLVLGPRRLPGGYERSQHQCGRSQCETTRESLVPSHELAQVVQGRGRPGHDRLIVEVPVDVGGQVASTLVAPTSVLLQCLERDRLQIAAQTPIDRAGSRWRGITDCLHRFVNTRMSQLIRRPAAQHLVEHKAQGIDVAA